MKPFRPMKTKDTILDTPAESKKIKVVQFDGKLYEVIGPVGNGHLKGYLLKSDRTRNRSHRFPATIPSRLCTFLDGYHEDPDTVRKVQGLLAGLSFAERMILHQEVCKECQPQR